MKARLIVTGIIEKDGTFLFGRKPKDVGPYPNTWHLIGGGVDVETESIEDAFRREVREEANIEVGALKHITFDEDYTKDKTGSDIHYVFLVFRTQYQAGEAKPGDDIEELKWLSKSELSKVPLTPPTYPLFKKLEIL